MLWYVNRSHALMASWVCFMFAVLSLLQFLVFIQQQPSDNHEWWNTRRTKWNGITFHVYRIYHSLYVHSLVELKLKLIQFCLRLLHIFQCENWFTKTSKLIDLQSLSNPAFFEQHSIWHETRNSILLNSISLLEYKRQIFFPISAVANKEIGLFFLLHKNWFITWVSSRRYWIQENLSRNRSIFHVILGDFSLLRLITKWSVIHLILGQIQ